jgi:tetratricopeptide (TPR) repeat protein/predicted Ser/Thr protein kinase
MTSASEPSHSTVAAEFIARYVSDDAAGRVRPLAEYLALYPGYEETVAREFADLEERRRTRETRRAADTAERTLGHFRIVRTIGRGGQGEVFLADDTRLKRRVALKTVRGWEKERIARFRREAEAASRLSHPGIATVYDVGEADGVHYIAMQYVEGQSLADALKEAREDGGEIANPVELIERLARALHVAHEAGLVHRDVKPGNIVVTEKGDPVLLDFGLVLDETSDTRDLTLSGQMTGTPAYLAPEQIAAQRIPVDRRADVYALGVTLYECLTLHRPFEAPTREQLYHQILVTPAPDPRRHVRTIGRDLRAVLETALEKDRDRRYQTALDFAEDLRRLREFEPVRARPAGPVLKLRRWTRRNRALAASLAAVFVALAGGFVVSLVLLAESDRARRDAEVGFRMATEAVQQMLTEVGLSEESLAGLPDLDDTRRRLLQRALAFYLRFLEARKEDARIHREILAARHRVAILHERLGDLEAAKREIEQALTECGALLAADPDRDELHLDNARFLRTEARILTAGSHHAEAMPLLERARAEIAALLPRHPGDPDYCLELGLTGLRLSYLRHRTGDLAGAETTVREARETLAALDPRSTGNLDQLNALAMAERHHALVLLEQNRLEESAAALREALAGFQTLVERLPNTSSCAVNRALTLCTLGDVESRRDHLGEAEPLLAEAVRALEVLAARHPGLVSVRQGLAEAMKFHADVLQAGGRNEEALARLTAAELIASELCRQFPESSNHERWLVQIRAARLTCLKSAGRSEEADAVEASLLAMASKGLENTDDVYLTQDLARLRMNVGYQRARSGDTEKGEELLDQAIKTFRALASRLPARPVFRADLAEALTKVASVRGKIGEPELAEDAHREALEIRRALVAERPHDPRYRSALGASLCNLAVSLGKRGAFEENRSLLEQAIAEQLAALRQDPKLPGAPRFLVLHYRLYGSTLLRLNEVDEAAEAAEELTRHLPENAEAHRSAAWLLTGCGGMVAGEDAAGADDYFARAVAHLGKAVDHGLTGAAAIRNDRRFRRLEGRKDFEAVLERLSNATGR